MTQSESLSVLHSALRCLGADRRAAVTQEPYEDAMFFYEANHLFIKGVDTTIEAEQISCIRYKLCQGSVLGYMVLYFEKYDCYYRLYIYFDDRSEILTLALAVHTDPARTMWGFRQVLKFLASVPETTEQSPMPAQDQNGE